MQNYSTKIIQQERQQSNHSLLLRSHGLNLGWAAGAQQGWEVGLFQPFPEVGIRPHRAPLLQQVLRSEPQDIGPGSLDPPQCQPPTLPVGAAGVGKGVQSSQPLFLGSRSILPPGVWRPIGKVDKGGNEGSE